MTLKSQVILEGNPHMQSHTKNSFFLLHLDFVPGLTLSKTVQGLSKYSESNGGIPKANDLESS